MPSFELQGTIQAIGDVQTFPSGFSKREFVLEVQDGKYPQPIKFECIKDKSSLLDKVSKGDKVNVNFDIRGSEHKGRHYVNLHAWKITKGGGDEKPGPHLSSLEAAFDNEPVDESEPPF
ncbi:MAG: DUF3127 domain-containing protein [Verrucomicrobiota bacterium JB023]|nr:DUF3127 domain-containing protein [Verrucomicrobiota bacterium JB023]